MAKFNTLWDLAPGGLSFTARGILTAGATAGFQYIFRSPDNFASGDTFRVNVSVTTNANGAGRTELVSTRLYATNGAGIANTAAPLSAITTESCTPTTYVPNTIHETSLTLTSALVKGTRYALRIFPDTTLNSTITFNVVFASGHPYTLNADEYHVNGTTISTGYPNLGVGNASSWYPPKCIKAVSLATTATTFVTSQAGFRFSLPTGLNYILTKIIGVNITLSATNALTGSFLGKILDSSGVTTLDSTTSVLTNDVRSSTNFTFNFNGGITLVGGTTYFFVVESDLDKRLNYFQIQEDSDASQTYSGEVNNMDVVTRNGTSGAFLSYSTLGPPAYRAVFHALIEATPVAVAAGGGMVVHPGLSGGING
jgi:hypothetical protein